MLFRTLSNGKFVPVHAIKAYGGAEVQLHSFIISALDGREWSTSCPGHFTRERTTAPIEQGVGWDLQPVCTLKEHPLSLPREAPPATLVTTTEHDMTDKV
jgi:hypothetical protein